MKRECEKNNQKLLPIVKMGNKRKKEQNIVQRNKKKRKQMGTKNSHIVQDRCLKKLNMKTNSQISE